MSTPPLPKGLKPSQAARVANRLHSQAIHLLRRARTVDGATGLSSERLSLLSVLVFAGPKTAGELAVIEMVSRPAITKIVGSLVELGLAKSSPGVEDRRQVRIEATAKGRALMEAGRRRRLKLLADELAALSPEEIAVLDRATRILESLGRDLR